MGILYTVQYVHWVQYVYFMCTKTRCIPLRLLHSRPAQFFLRRYRLSFEHLRELPQQSLFNSEKILWLGRGNLSLKFETYQKLSQIFFNQVSLCGECGVGGGWQCLHQLADAGPAAAGQNTLHAAPHHALPRGNQIEQSIGYPPTTNVHGPMHRIRILQKGRQRSSMQSG